MSSTINASTSGAGGIITSADASGELALQTAGVTALSIDASQNVALTNPLPVASGGSGSTTSTGTGANVLATSPTLVTPNLGTPSAVVLTNATGTAGNLDAGVGAGQTWQIVTGSRAFGTTYTNSTSKSIMVFISCSGSGVNTITVGGVAIGSFQANASAVNSNASFIVPAGATYVVSTGATLAKWSELRQDKL